MLNSPNQTYHIFSVQAFLFLNSLQFSFSFSLTPNPLSHTQSHTHLLLSSCLSNQCHAMTEKEVFSLSAELNEPVVLLSFPCLHPSIPSQPLCPSSPLHILASSLLNFTPTKPYSRGFRAQCDNPTLSVISVPRSTTRPNWQPPVTAPNLCRLSANWKQLYGAQQTTNTDTREMMRRRDLRFWRRVALHRDLKMRM